MHRAILSLAAAKWRLSGNLILVNSRIAPALTERHVGNVKSTPTWHKAQKGVLFDRVPTV
jgi:hypothetical protein